MTRLLVTGASGLLGSNVVLEASRNLDVTAVVHSNRVLFSHVKVVEADLLKRSMVEALFEDIEPEWVIHCAADIAIDELESNTERASQHNTEMARDVARAAAESHTRLLFVSTDSVFEGSAGPYCEDDIPDPQNVYARSKLSGEMAVAEEYPGALIVRTNLFGWSPSPKQSLAEWFYHRLETGKSCPGFTDIYFSPVYARELAHIFLRMLDEGLEGLYHVPGADCVSKYDFGVRLAHEFGFDQALIERAESTQINWSAKRPRRTCLNGTKITHDLGIELPNLNDGLAQFRTDNKPEFL